MPRKPQKFYQSELERAIRATKACGLKVTMTTIAPDGTLTIHHENYQPPIDAYDEWKEHKNAS